MSKDKEITFIGNFVTDTSIVALIVDKVIKDLLKMDYPREEIDEIAISMDESIANAVSATIANIAESTKENPKKPYITIRYAISETEFDATIIDQGKGLDLFKTLSTTPDIDSEDYHNQVMTYTEDTEKSQSSLTMNNKNIQLKGVGAGLKIISSFMDSVSIEYIDRNTIIATKISESTEGTIFNMKRKRRNFSNA